MGMEKALLNILATNAALPPPTFFLAEPHTPSFTTMPPAKPKFTLGKGGGGNSARGSVAVRGRAALSFSQRESLSLCFPAFACFGFSHRVASSPSDARDSPIPKVSFRANCGTSVELSYQMSIVIYTNLPYAFKGSYILGDSAVVAVSFS